MSIALPSPANATTDVELAKRYYNLGAQLFKRGDYKDALSQFKESYRLSKRPELLYNMGRCHEGMGDLDRAISNYEAFIKGSPPSVDQVRAEVEKIRLRREKRANSAKPMPAPRTEAKPLRTAGWVLVGAGAASLVAGGVLGGLAMSKQSTVEDSYRNADKTYPELQEEVDQGEAMELGAIISLAVGVPYGTGEKIIGDAGIYMAGNPSVAYMASSGRYLVVWEDRRNGNSDIYGARVDKNGQVLASDKFGLKLATGGNYQMSPRVACQKETCLVTFAHGSFATAMTSIRGVRLETINKVFTVVDNPGIFLASVYRVAAPYAVTDSSGNFAVFWRIYQLNSASYIKALLFKP